MVLFLKEELSLNWLGADLPAPGRGLNGSLLVLFHGMCLLNLPKYCANSQRNGAFAVGAVLCTHR